MRILPIIAAMALFLTGSAAIAQAPPPSAGGYGDPYNLAPPKSPIEPAPNSTPQAAQSYLDTVPFVNGKGLVTGQQVRDNYQELINVLNGMGKWPGGVYVPPPPASYNATGGPTAIAITGGPNALAITGGQPGGYNLYVNPTQPPDGVWIAAGNTYGTCPLTQSPCGAFPGDTSYNVYSSQYIKDTSTLGATQQEFNWSLDSYINSGAAPQWTPSTIYAAGSCVDTTVPGTSQSSNTYCTRDGGKSADAGVGPSGLVVPIVDGSVTWTSAIGSFTNQKVGWFNSTLVGPNAASRTWGNAEATIWQKGYTGIQGFNFEMDSENDGVNVNLPGRIVENLRVAGSTGIYPLTCDVCIWHSESTQPVQAGSFATGQFYTILNPGSTDFTSIGSAFNSAGTIFQATGPGAGDGTAINTYSTQYGILINDANQASVADFYDNTNSREVFATSGNHRDAVWNDNSSSPAAVSLGGNYSVAQIIGKGFKVSPSGDATFNLLNLPSTVGDPGTVNKINLYASTYGFGVSNGVDGNGSLDYMAPTNGSHTWYVNGSVAATLKQTNLTLNAGLLNFPDTSGTLATPNKINLFSSTFGFGVSSGVDGSGSLDYTVPGNAAHSFYVGNNLSFAVSQYGFGVSTGGNFSGQVSMTSANLTSTTIGRLPGCAKDRAGTIYYVENVDVASYGKGVGDPGSNGALVVCVRRGNNFAWVFD